jgi:hypothetical protein
VVVLLLEQRTLPLQGLLLEHLRLRLLLEGALPLQGLLLLEGCTLPLQGLLLEHLRLLLLEDALAL